MNTTKPIRQVLDGERRSSLLEGDCLVEARRVPSEAVDAVVVDPPYGAKYRGWNNQRAAIANDERPFIWFLPEAHRVLRDGGALLCFCQWRMQQDFRRAIELAGFRVMSQVIWDKQHHGMGNTVCMFAPRHEIIWFATKGRFRFPAGRPASVLPHRGVPVPQRVHSTQKPIELMTELIRAVTPEGGLVFDPCAGSGSTGEAAVRAGFRFIGIELDAENAATARRRLRKPMAKRAAAPRGRRAPSMSRRVGCSVGRICA